jgi:hypothetical protein
MLALAPWYHHRMSQVTGVWIVVVRARLYRYCGNTGLHTSTTPGGPDTEESSTVLTSDSSPCTGRLIEVLVAVVLCYVSQQVGFMLAVLLYPKLPLAFWKSHGLVRRMILASEKFRLIIHRCHVREEKCEEKERRL